MKIVTLFGLTLALVCRSSLGLKCWECSNARTNEECLETGHLKDCVEKDAICEDQIRHQQSGFSILIEKRCKQDHACKNNVDQNIKQAYPIQCNTKSPTSVCRCCCKTDACNRDLLACWNQIPQYDNPLERSCEKFPEPPVNGNMQCYGNKEVETYCTFSCHDGYVMEGRDRVDCTDDLVWAPDVPKCNVITCPPRPSRPGNGSVHCSDGINLKSRCTFMCHPDYQLIGSSVTECVDVGRGDGTGDWTTPTPWCKPLVCPPQGPIPHGSISCTRGRRIRSQCSFSCARDFVLYPPGNTNNECVAGGQWSSTLPCCQLPCPPFALMDFVVVMDSSSSVGAENWEKMKTFVRHFLGDFRVRQDSAHYAVIRYNRAVDEQTQVGIAANAESPANLTSTEQTSKNLAPIVIRTHGLWFQGPILFNDYTDNIQPLLRAFDAIPYDGSGTRTGNALNYTADVLLKVGNRPEARDVVLLITDGASQDSVINEAKRIRDSGALFFILPIKPPTGRLNMDEIVAMAGPGNGDKVIRDALERGFDALDKEFAQRMSQLLCGDPCQ